MKKLLLLFTFISLAYVGVGQTTIAFQSFESGSDDWSYNVNPTAFTDGSDVWDIVDDGWQSNLSTMASDGSKYWGAQDLNSPDGTTDFGSITFANIDVSSYNSVEISFDYDVYEFDNGDDIKYEPFFDETSQGETLLIDGSSNYSENGTVLINVPDGTNSVYIILSVKQNGGADYAGFDNFVVRGTSSTGVDNPTSFAAAASSASQIDLSWTLNGDGDNVIIVYDEEGTFTDPVDGSTYSGSALGGTVIYNSNGTSFNHTSLSSNTQYYYKAWSVDGSNNYSSGVEDNATTLKLEPTNHVTSFSASSNGTTEIGLTWIDNDGAQEADGFLIQVETDGIFDDRLDGTTYSVNEDFTDGSGIVDVAHGVGSYTASGLTEGTNYFFKIWPYTNSGSDINYKTDGTVPVATAKTDDATGGGTSTFYTLDFETAGGYSTSVTEFTDGGGDYFTRTNGSDISGESFNDIQGSYYFGAQDIDGEGATLPVTLTIDDIDITSRTGLEFAIMIAEDDDGSNQDWDDVDYMHIEYNIDDNGFNNLIWVESELSSGSNGEPKIDTDFDGVGDGTAITDTFSEFTSTIGETGSSMDIRITFNLNSGDEDIAIDDIKLSSTTVVSTVTWDDGGADSFWNTADNWDGNTVPTASDNVVIPTNGQVNIASGKATANCNDLTIQSDATGTGSLINEGTLSIGGEVIAERYIDGYSTSDDQEWHLLSSPIDNMEIAGSDFVRLEGTDDFYSWSEDQYMWINYDGDSMTNFTNGQGYLIAYDETDTREFEGSQLNNNDITGISLSHTSDKGDGWNLLGNPFPSAIIWNDGTNWDAPSDMQEIAKVYNESTGSYEDVDPNEVIPTNQGFFVQVNTDVSGFSIPAAARTHSTTNFYKSGNEGKLELRVYSENNSLSDIVAFDLNKQSDETYDRFDSEKFFGYSNAPQVYSIDEVIGNLSTHSVHPSSIEESRIFALGVQAVIEGNYAVTINENAFENDHEIKLEDLATGEMIDIENIEAYEFTASPDDAEHRFNLHLTKASAIGLDENEELAGVHIYANKRNIYFNADENLTNATLTVYNTIGQVVLTTNVETGSEIIRMDNRGAYIVKVQSNEGSMTEKVIIK